MLNYYSNKDYIVESKKPTVGKYFNSKDEKLLNGELVSVNFGLENDLVELHIYSQDGSYITSDYNVDNWKVVPSKTQDYPDIIEVDVHNNIRDIGITSGNYKFIYNFHRLIAGSPNASKLYLSQISSDRTEIELIPQDEDVSNQISSIISLLTTIKDFYEDFVVNFGENKNLKVVNAKISSNKIVCKLYNELPFEITEKDTCWLALDVRPSYIDNISLYTKRKEKKAKSLSGPNFDINVDNNTSIETNFKSWNDILGSNLVTSQQIIDEYFSSSLYEVKLNINYNDFNNFIHFSSAEERVKNFKYKLELLEFYEKRISLLSNVTGSVENNVIEAFNKRSDIISGFDDFEKYMYFESASGYYTHITGSYSPWPKYTNNNSSAYAWQEAFTRWTNTNPITSSAGGILTVNSYVPEYKLYHTTSSVATTYYNNLLTQSIDYDRENVHKLIDTIPEDIRNRGFSQDYVLFVNMMGHHFDILWSYVNSLSNIYKREEHPKDGIPSDLIYNVAKSMGWQLNSGKKYTELWNYVLGTDTTGSYQNTGSMETKTYGDITKEIWRRTLNNLPYLLKTKGTERSVKALMSCYGVPNTILRIKEYGGPAVYNDRPEYIINKFNYAVYFETGSEQYFRVPSQPNSVTPKTIEFRIKPEEPPTGSVWYEIFSDGSDMKFEIQKTGSNGDDRGNAKFTDGAVTLTISDKYIFDDNFTSVMVRQNADNTSELFVKKAKYGKLVINESSSAANAGWALSGDITFGSKLTGSVQEFRLWSTPLTESAFDNHVTAPNAYNGNSPTSSYYDLLLRIPMVEKFDLNATSSVSSSQPNQNYHVTASFINFHSESFNTVEEKQYIECLSVGGNNIYSQKIRIEDDKLLRTLNSDTRATRGAFDNHPLDSSNLGIYFSPQNVIDEDIYEHVGFTELDNYIGDPADTYEHHYKDLKRFSAEYWKKYPDRSKWSDYLRAISIFDFSLFYQIKKLLPLRSNPITGLLIEPNVLERSKIVIREPSLSTHHYNVTIDKNIIPNPTASYTYYTASIEDIVSVMTGSLVDTGNYVGLVSGSRGVEAAQYRFYKTIRNQIANMPPIFITASNPYWEYNAIATIVTGSRKAWHRKEAKYFYSSSYSASLNKYYSSSLEPAEVLDVSQMTTGLRRSWYDGSKLTGTEINADTVNTIDGGPVVEIFETNPNQLIYTGEGSSGSLTVE